ncbi:hypothetical protein X768_22905 [Mesorhizobium sp. LSJC265A00]|nr:hypothetical protein X768_22905 [Mesorhizobium sp. LSJC265A00]
MLHGRLSLMLGAGLSDSVNTISVRDDHLIAKQAASGARHSSAVAK